MVRKILEINREKHPVYLSLPLPSFTFFILSISLCFYTSLILLLSLLSSTQCLSRKISAINGVSLALLVSSGTLNTLPCSNFHNRRKSRSFWSINTHIMEENQSLLTQENKMWWSSCRFSMKALKWRSQKSFPCLPSCACLCMNQAPGFGSYSRPFLYRLFFFIF